MNEIYETDLDGDSELDRMQYEEHSDGGATALVDLDGDGRLDLALYDADGDGHVDYVAAAEHAGESHGDGSGDGYGHAEHAGYAEGGTSYANDYLGTGVGSSADGSAGYVNVGDGQFVSWGS